LNVRFTRPEAGWIGLHVPGLTWSHGARCSCVFDPFPEFIEWLEQIVAGARDATWSFDEEGTTASFIFQSGARDLDGGEARLIHCIASHEVWWLSARAISARAVVAGFYRAFRQMTDDPLYEPSQWEMPEHEPALAFDNADERWTSQVEARWRAREQANPHGGSILRFLRSETIEQALSGPGAEGMLRPAPVLPRGRAPAPPRPTG
jgi:hypothetical protein